VLAAFAVVYGILEEARKRRNFLVQGAVAGLVATSMV